MLSALSFVVFMISLGTFITSLRIYIESTDATRRQQQSVTELRAENEKLSNILNYNESEMRRLSRAASKIEDIEAKMDGVRVMRIFRRDELNN